MANESVDRELLQTRNWYVRQRGEEVGPMTETALRQLLEQNAVDGESFARQGESAYFPIDKIRGLFEALSADGWYVLEDGKTHGPYLAEKLSTLMKSGFFSAEHALVRQGKGGDWATWKDTLRKARQEARQQDRPDASSNQSGDGKDTESVFITCETCGRRYPKSHGECSDCSRAAEKEELRSQNRTIRDALVNSPDHLAYLVILCITLGTSGYFISKWLITSVLWSGYYAPSERTEGWFCLGIAAVLAVVGALVIYSDSKRRTDTRVLLSGLASFLLVGLVFYLSQHGRLSAAQQQLEQQNQAWSEMMQDGGYGNWQD